jgi:hypothetical protein
LAIVILFILSVMHFSTVLVQAYFGLEKFNRYTNPMIFVAVPFKDGCIALLMTRLYYYQGTSEKRNKKVLIGQ